MARLASYRSGDRAEGFGGFLMQKFCALAPVPRQEDFGLFDAVATLLRRDGRYLYAEDSFLVQFKSSSTPKVEYKKSERFSALLNQELALFIVLVDLKTANIKMYSVGVALAHPNINDARGLVVHFKTAKNKRSGLDEDRILHVYLSPPALHLSMADLEKRNSAKAENAYTVMKAWLELDRENRRYRQMGRRIQIQWQKNEVPSKRGTSFIVSTGRLQNAVGELVPVIESLFAFAMSEPELAVPMMQILSWMQSHGTEADSMNVLNIQGLLIEMNRIHDHLREELARTDRADLAVCLCPIENEPGSCVFWEFVEHSGGTSRYSKKHRCSNLDEFRALGIEATINPGTQTVERINLDERCRICWNAECIEIRNGVLLLRRMDSV